MSDGHQNGGAAASVSAVNNEVDKGADMAAKAQADAKNMQDAVARKSAEMLDKVGQSLNDAGVDANQLIASAKAQVNDLRGAFVNEIKARPVQAIVAAGLAGLLIGILTAR